MKYLPRKDGLHDLREVLYLRAKVTLTPEQESEIASLYARLDRLTAVEIVDVIGAALDSGLPLRPVRREPIPVRETWPGHQDEEESRESVFAAASDDKVR